MVLLFIILVLSAIFAYTGVSAAPWVPVRRHDVEALLDDAQLMPGEVFVELGCGDGRLVRAAALRGAKAVGYELNPVLWFVAWVRCLGVANARIRLKDLWRVDISAADVVMAFMVERTVGRLEKKAEAEIKKRGRLVSYVFPLPHKKPYKIAKSWNIYRY